MEFLYANYKYHGQNINNLGDHLQILTIDYLYELMGIPKEKIVYIDIGDLSTYNGETVYLPVSMPLINYSEYGAASMFSDKIIPVFFGLTMPRETLCIEEVEYFKKHEPVGCRDEYTYSTLKLYGINAYLGGCLTVSLPKRKEDQAAQKKVFIVDVPKSLLSEVPNEILENAEFDTHIFYNHMDDPQAVAELRYKKYRDEARLMITGLLHASVPCMAYGIPTILARDIVSYRFSWLEALLPIYTKDEYKTIDWNPQALDIEAHKKVIIELFRKRMTGGNADNEIHYLHNLYMNRERKTYMNDVFFEIQSFIDSNWTNKEKAYNYAVWGMTQMAVLTVDYIKKRYPNARLTHVYDIKPNISFMGLKTISPDNIKDSPSETVFVTTVSAAAPAQKMFNEIGKPKELYQLTTIVR